MAEKLRSPEENEGGDFLKEKYQDLPNSSEVESASKRHEIRTGEKPKNKQEKIGAYLDRLEEIFENPDEAKKERVIDFVKEKLYEKFVIKEIPESYFKLQQKIAREQGHGDVEVTDMARQEAKKTIVKDQEQSLDNWIDYLGSEDAPYPNWLKYWTVRSIAGLSSYDKEKHEFKKRSKGTVAPFPDINREALSYVLDAVEKKHTGKKEEVTDENWEKLLKTENFGKLYAHAIEKITPASEEEKENIQGEWVKYDQGSDAKPLYESLQGHGTGWCTAGESMAESQLAAGDFYVFYSKDQKGLAKIPRVAIRMQNDEIAEVRGIQAEQNLEPVMTDVTKEKMKELPGGEKYKKKVEDMKRLTEIEKKFIDIKKIEQKINESRRKYNNHEYKDVSSRQIELFEAIDLADELKEANHKNRELKLEKEELRFLYEIDGKIEGFGYQDDPRIYEFRSKRDKKQDYITIYECDCSREELALSMKELNYKTKVLVGDLICKPTYNTDGFLAPELPPDLRRITGDADFKNSNVVWLGSLEVIDGSADFSYSNMVDFGKLKRIGKDANFDGFFSHIYRLPPTIKELEYIGRDASFLYCTVKKFEKLEHIGRNVIIDPDSKLDLSNVTIGGKIIKKDN